MALNRMQMFHEQDPAQEILNKIGDLSGIDLLFSQVLLADYIRPEKTASGFILPTKTRDEERFQGKAGLVIMKGPRAFVDDGDVKFHGQTVSVGDWLVYRKSDGWEMEINGCNCRVLQDVHVKMRVSSPDAVW